MNLSMIDVSPAATWLTMWHTFWRYFILFGWLYLFLIIWQLPDAFKDFVAEHGGEGINISTVIKHCRRELMHAQWDILLDEEFIEAYEHGIVVQCCDNMRRRFYPRFITYSADYKEK